MKAKPAIKIISKADNLESDKTYLSYADYPVNAEIRNRFFQALDHLIEVERLKNVNTFTTLYKINPGNFYRMRQSEASIIPPAFLNFLVNDYKVSANWLLTGKGKIMTV